MRFFSAGFFHESIVPNYKVTPQNIFENIVVFRGDIRETRFF